MSPARFALQLDWIRYLHHIHTSFTASPARRKERAKWPCTTRMADAKFAALLPDGLRFVSGWADGTARIAEIGRLH